MTDKDESSKDNQKQLQSSEPTDLKDDTSNAPVDEAINDIVRHESDEVLVAEDGEQRSVTKGASPWYKKKKIFIPAIIIIVIIALFAIPLTRYPILGLVWKQNYVVQVVDSQTNQPVTAVSISLDGKTVETNNLGEANLRVKVGKSTIVVSKKYYASDTQKVLVPLKIHSAKVFQLLATGRQVPITLTNKIGGTPISNATVTSAGTKATTDSSGKADIVLPADKSSESATITASGYNMTSVNIEVTSKAVSTNSFQLIPSGQIYFLSNASGSVDVVKASLDGTNPQTVIKGTGDEDANNTQLLASTDWKYVALISRRSGTSTNLYLINTSTDQLTDVDSSNAEFNFNGWTSTDYLVYTVSNNNSTLGQPGGTLLKSYNAATGKTTTLDQTGGQSMDANTVVYETYGGVNILNNNTILYLKSWQGAVSSFTGLNITINSILPNGSSKTVIQSFPETQYASFPSSAAAGPSSVYYYLYPATSGTTSYYEYTSGNMEQLNASSTSAAVAAQNNSSAYLTSPSSQATLWSNQVNGHSAIYVGDGAGNNQKQVALLDSDYIPDGWYTNNYILLSKNNNELYIMPVGGVTNVSQLVKVSDYL